MENDKWNDPGTKKTFSFNEEGKLVDSEGNGPQKGFKNDDRFGDWLHSYVVKQMISMGLKTINVPEEGGAPIYFTHNAFNQPEKLLVLICGSGRIMAGLWSVGVCAYHGLSNGSVLPFLSDASSRGFEVVILNPNHHGYKAITTKYGTNIGMVKHTLFAFENLIIPSNPQKISIVCHSMGGECTCAVAKRWPQWFSEHITAIAMTDACESKFGELEGIDMNEFMHKICINWICSDEPINSLLSQNGRASVHRSAGTTDHPLSTGKAYPYIWEFFDSMNQ